ncbi:MAG: DsrE family protein [Chloroflexi bacterium]|nr:DsrE family protein [Chloroflexota bacterium]
MAKTLAIILGSTPHGKESSHTAARMAAAALEQGYGVTLFATADGVHNFTLGQKIAGLPNPLEALIARGMRVDLCGSCLTLRDIDRGALASGAEPSSLKNLFAIVADSHTVINLG